MSGAGLLAGVCGALLVAGPLVGAYALTEPDVPARPQRRRLRWTKRLDARAARKHRVLWAAAAAATCGVWLSSGWPVGGILAGLAVVGVPWLLGQFSAGSVEVQRL